MAAGEDEAEPVVDRVHLRVVAAPGRRGGVERRKPREFLAADALAPQAIDRAAARGGEDPGRWMRRKAVERPALERNDVRVGDGVFGEAEIADRAGQRRHRAARVVTEAARDPFLDVSLHPRWTVRP